MDRRAFLARALSGVATLAMARSLGAQQEPRQTMSGPMDETAYVPVRRAPRPGATPKVSTAERDALESRLKCGCRCPLDVYTCRTTDFTCSVSPRMHADVEALIAGGYDREEITAAFVDTWGERVLTAPKAEGFNVMAYVAPFAGLAIGGTIAAVLIRRWMRPVVAQPETAGRIPQVAASPDELARLEAAVRDEA
jgi:cytochrome c-type biogenesis protein CcmH